jgi:hypothetical protein
MLQIDIKKLVLWLVPEFIRKNNTLLLLYAFTLTVRNLYNSFQRFVQDKLYRLNHNSQVCYLRAVLNDRFDLIERRILITDFEGIERIYFWPDNALRDVNFGVTQYFWPESAYADSGIDFTVKIPAGVAVTASEMARLQSQINEYKLPGKNYNIIRL